MSTTRSTARSRAGRGRCRGEGDVEARGGEGDVEAGVWLMLPSGRVEGCSESEREVLRARKGCESIPLLAIVEKANLSP